MYVNFQPNNKDPKANQGRSKYDDSIIRALCMAENLTWLDAFDKLTEISREMQCPITCVDCYNKLLLNLGYEYHSLGARRKGEVLRTVDNFSRNHRHSTLLFKLRGRIVCAKDGDYYDTFDCGNCTIYGYWEKP